MRLKIDGITKSYGSNLALDGFTAILENGIYALLGTNGSGKSTLMNILTDNLKADSGTVTCTDDSGKEENILDMGARFRANLGFMPQYPGLYPTFTVERFLWYMASLKGMKKEIAEKQIPEILKAVALDDVPNRKIGALSGGMKQRLTLAQAVLGDPKILILDEPTAGLDPKQRIAIRNYISEISAGRIVLIATHVVSDIEFVSREIIMLKKGRIARCGVPAELLKEIVGKVWIIPCSGDDIGAVQGKFRTTAVTRDDFSGETLLRVLSDSRPMENAKAVAPTLEDYYLWVFGDDADRG